MIASVDNAKNREQFPAKCRQDPEGDTSDDTDRFDRLAATDPEKALKQIPRLAGPVPSLRSVPFYKKIVANKGLVGEKALEGLVSSYTFSMRQDPSLERKALFYLSRLVERRPDDVIVRMRRAEMALDIMLRDAFNYSKADWIKFDYPFDVPTGKIDRDAEVIILEDLLFVIQCVGFLCPYANIVLLCDYVDEDENIRALIAQICDATRRWLLKKVGSAAERSEAERLLTWTTSN